MTGIGAAVWRTMGYMGYDFNRQKAAQPQLEQAAPPETAAKETPAQAYGITAPLPVHEGADPVEMAVRGRFRYPDLEEETGKTPQEVMEESECQTCEQRRYQDGSDDPGVSFKTPTRLSPERAASAVRSHELEHVSREQAKAEREGREVIGQTVTIHTAICPECGRAYVSGGTTRTTTAKKAEPQAGRTAADGRD